jgi:16S rRNA (guanine1207-N2)-methyltransferase
MNSSTDTPDGRPTSHYFDSQPTTASHRTEFTLNVGETTLTLASESGVFSSRGLDKGTAVLLDWALRQQLPELPEGSLLCDLGCGSGPIALTMATLYPHCTVHAVDINARARQLCRDNADRNNITNMVTIDPANRKSENRYALLWSNPPIRIGKSELHDLLRTWLGQLDDNACAHLVVSKNLGADSLMTWLNNHGMAATKRASSKGFRIIETRRTSGETH